jgi:hypothetical protein
MSGKKNIRRYSPVTMVRRAMDKVNRKKNREERAFVRNMKMARCWMPIPAMTPRNSRLR